MGHDVTVLTGFPNHPTGVVPAEWRSRCAVFVTQKQSTAYASNAPGSGRCRTAKRTKESATTHRSASRRRSAASISRSPMSSSRPPRNCWCALRDGGWRAGSAFRLSSKCVIFGRNRLRPLARAAKALCCIALCGAIAGFLYRRADRIVVVTPAFKDHLIRYWHVPADKISIVENGVETDLFRPDPAARRNSQGIQLNSVEGTIVS